MNDDISDNAGFSSSGGSPPQSVAIHHNEKEKCNSLSDSDNNMSKYSNGGIENVSEHFSLRHSPSQFDAGNVPADDVAAPAAERLTQLMDHCVNCVNVDTYLTPSVDSLENGTSLTVEQCKNDETLILCSKLVTDSLGCSEEVKSAFDNHPQVGGSPNKCLSVNASTVARDVKSFDASFGKRSPGLARRCIPSTTTPVEGSEKSTSHTANKIKTPGVIDLRETHSEEFNDRSRSVDFFRESAQLSELLRHSNRIGRVVATRDALPVPDDCTNVPLSSSLTGAPPLSRSLTQSGDIAMPSLEDGLSSGHDSDDDADEPNVTDSLDKLAHQRESTSSYTEESGNHELADKDRYSNEQHRFDVEQRLESHSATAQGISHDLDPVLELERKQQVVELAIQEIKNAIRQSSKVPLVKPALPDDDRHRLCDSGNQNLDPWVTRASSTRDSRRPVVGVQTVSQISSRPPKNVVPFDEEDSTDSAEKPCSRFDGKSSPGRARRLTSSRHDQLQQRRNNTIPSTNKCNNSSETANHCISNRQLAQNTQQVFVPGLGTDSSFQCTSDPQASTLPSTLVVDSGTNLSDVVDRKSCFAVKSSRGEEYESTESLPKCHYCEGRNDYDEYDDNEDESAGDDYGEDDDDDIKEYFDDEEEASRVRRRKKIDSGEFAADEETDELLRREYSKHRGDAGGGVIPKIGNGPDGQPDESYRAGHSTESAGSSTKTRAHEVTLSDPDDDKVLIKGVLFRAAYLGSTQLISEGQPSRAMRMMQAQDAVGRIKAPDDEHQPSTEVDLFISVEKLMVLNTDLQSIMMDYSLRTISYIADIGNILVLMARRGPVTPASPAAGNGRTRNQTKICCHLFESDEAQLIAQSIGQAFQVAYINFLKANGVDTRGQLQEDYEDVLNQQEIFGEELYLFSNREMQRDVIVSKPKGEPLGVVIVESGWGSMVPTVVLANMSPTGAAARGGQLNIGDQIMSVNGVSLVGLPLSTCQNYVKATKSQSLVTLSVVSCPPVVEVLIKRPDVKYQLGFSVQNGIICSLLRGGIAERGGVRVGHKIIDINGQSVVAVTHERIVNMLATSVGEITMKTMPTAIYRLLTGQDTPHYI